MIKCHGDVDSDEQSRKECAGVLEKERKKKKKQVSVCDHCPSIQSIFFNRLVFLSDDLFSQNHRKWFANTSQKKVFQR